MNLLKVLYSPIPSSWSETDESQKLFSEMFPQNSARVARQKSTVASDYRQSAIFYWSKIANDNAQNQKYQSWTHALQAPMLLNLMQDLTSRCMMRTSKHFVEHRPFRPKEWWNHCLCEQWSLVDGNSTDGFRKSLEKNSAFGF